MSIEDLSVEEFVITTISETAYIEREKITRQSDIIKDLGVESLDHLLILNKIANRYDIEFPETDEGAKRLEVVGSLIDYIELHKYENRRLGIV